MPKCVKRLSDGRVAQVSDKAASLMIKSKLWKYISKSQFKKAIKVFKKNERLKEPDMMEKIHTLQKHFSKLSKKQRKKVNKSHPEGYCADCRVFHLR